MAPVPTSIAAYVGRTPMVQLTRVLDGAEVELFAKLEQFNPGGSVKDRAGLFIIADAEKRGILKPGGIVVEGTAGKTGIGKT